MNSIKNAIITLALLTVPLISGTITKTLNFSLSDFVFKKIDGYDLIILSGESETREIGAPLLPKKLVNFIIPPDAEVTKVVVISKREIEITGFYHLCPCQKPFPFSHPEIAEFIPPDEYIYSSSNVYPAKDIEFYPAGTKSGFGIAGIAIYPLKYIPAQGKLLLTTSITIQLEYTQGKNNIILSKRQYQIFSQEIRSLIVNPEDVTRFSPPSKRNLDSIEYVIITTDDLISAFQPLADWRTRQGWNTEIKTTSWIYSNYSGYDNEEQIRNFIKDYFTNKGLVWVLIGGDADVVPVRRAYLPVYGDPYIATDLYYSDLDGTWDGNGNHKYGEMDDGVDLYADVFVGRVPADHTLNVTNYINKQNIFEKNPSIDYLKKILLPSVLLFPETGQHGREVNNAIADTTPSDWLDAKLEDPSRYGMRDNLNLGYQFCHPATHGNEYGFYYVTGMPIFKIEDISTLTNNDKYTILNSIACYSGNFDEYDCLAESLVNIYPNGCIATIMNTRYGWGIYYEFGPSEKLGMKFYGEFFNRNTFKLGLCHARSKDAFRNIALTDEHYRYCIYELTLFGDPGLPMWEKEPATMSVSHPSVIPVSPINVIISVNSGEMLVDHALVCCYKQGEVHETGYTDASGNVMLNIEPLTEGIMNITVTAKDMLPYEGTCEVRILDYAYVIYQKSTVIDTLGNNNGRVNPGETIDLPLWVQNWGSVTAYGITGKLKTIDSFIVITDSLKFFGDIAPSDSAHTGSDGYNFSVSNSCPNGHQIPFDLICKDSADSTWVSQFSIWVYAPALTYQDTKVIGGNNNGLLDPSETADLVITLKNEGWETASDVIATLRSLSSFVVVDDSSGNFGTILPDSITDNSNDPFTVTASSTIPEGTIAQFTLLVTSGVYTDTLEFDLCIGRSHYFIWSPAPNPCWGEIIYNILDSLDYLGDYSTVLTPTLDNYQAVFICAGVAPNKYVLCGDEALSLVNYLNSGGRMYLEGGDVWFYDPNNAGGYDFCPIFGIQPLSDGGNDMGPVIGKTGTFTQGMNFEYEGGNKWMDRITSTGTGFVIFHDTDDNYDCGVANDAGTYKTVGTSFELGGLVDAIPPSTCAALLDSIMHFFGIYQYGIQEEQISSFVLQTPMLQIYPNPFREKVKIKYCIGRSTSGETEGIEQRAELKIYDVTGRLVKNFNLSTTCAPRPTHVSWDGTDDLGRRVAQGVYFIRLKTMDNKISKKVILIKK
jgi:hypothetical protein